MNGLKRFLHRLTLFAAIVGYKVGRDEWIDTYYELGPFIRDRRLGPVQAWHIAGKVMIRKTKLNAQTNTFE